MPTLRAIISPLVAVAIVAILAFGLWSLLLSPSPVVAVPHIISGPHPYDSDWPEVYSILSKKCAGCHRPGTDRVDLSTYKAVLAAQVIDEGQVVVPGNPKESQLFKYIRWDEHATSDSDLPKMPRMPEDKLEWLTQGQQQAVSRWIANGAFEFELPATCDTSPITEIDFPSAKQCQACHQIGRAHV